MEDPKVQLFVIGFHHRRGHEVEYCFPHIGSQEGKGENSEVALPEQWSMLPSLCLPDGVHNVETDMVCFVLPSLESPNRHLFGIACYRQIASSEVVAPKGEHPRSSIQKSVCVVSKWPLYGLIANKLELITGAYFAERDFTKVEVLNQMCANLLDLCSSGYLDSQTLCAGRVDDMHAEAIKENLSKVVFNIFPAKLMSEVMLGLISLFPLLLEEGLSELGDSTSATQKKVGHEETMIVGSTIIASSSMKTDELGFPLRVFSKGYLFRPYLSIDSLDLIRSTKVPAYCIGVTNSIFLQHHLIDATVTIKVNGEGRIEVITPDLKPQLALTRQDEKFMDFILRVVEGHSEDSEWEGSDCWVRSHFFNYLIALLNSARSAAAEDERNFLADFNASFVQAYRSKQNYLLWARGNHCSDPSLKELRHPFTGSASRASDLRNGLERTITSVPEGTKRLMSRLGQTSQFLSTSGSRLGSSIRSWAKR